MISSCVVNAERGALSVSKAVISIVHLVAPAKASGRARVLVGRSARLLPAMPTECLRLCHHVGPILQHLLYEAIRALDSHSLSRRRLLYILTINAALTRGAVFLFQAHRQRRLLIYAASTTEAAIGAYHGGLIGSHERSTITSVLLIVIKRSLPQRFRIYKTIHLVVDE